MAAIFPKFKLKKPNSGKSTLIVLKVYYKSRRFTYSTGEKIHPNHWDNIQKEESYRLIYPINGKGNKELRDQLHETAYQLERYKNAIKSVFSEFQKRGVIPSAEMVKKEMDKEFKQPTATGWGDLLSFADTLINESIDGERTTRGGNRISEITVKGYKTTVNHLMEFQASERFHLSFENINMRFYRRFQRYFHRMGYATNTFGKNIKNVKVFMKEAYWRGVTTNRIFEAEDFRITEEETDQIYLTEEELGKIYSHDLSDNPRLDRVRDLLIVGCRTGLSFSDLSSLSKETIDPKAEIIKLKTQKAGEIVVIPIHWMVRGIIEKHNGQIPGGMSNQKLNVYIKEVGKAAGIETKVKVARTQGGLRVDKSLMKYKLMTTHTSRRSFATNAYLSDIPTLLIMKITGHKTVRSFLKYIRVSQEDNARKLLDHPFFKQSPYTATLTATTKRNNPIIH